jgi:hypothetical protein
MSSKLRAIQPIARTVWDRAALKTKIDQQVWENAKSVGCVAAPVPVASSSGICPARIHADFNRMLRGDGPAFPETAPALEKLKAELNRLGFVANNHSRYVYSEALGICGEVDAQGMVDGYMPAIVELKVVRWIPQVVRSADTVQLMLYELARSGRADSSTLIGLYIQPSGEFRTAARIVFEPKKLEPLVREVAA